MTAGYISLCVVIILRKRSSIIPGQLKCEGKQLFILWKFEENFLLAVSTQQEH